MNPARGLTPAQHSIYSEGWTSEARFRVAVCGRRFGKALDVRTEIPTAAGWVAIGDLSVGDVVFDERGMPCRVSAATSVMQDRPCREVSWNDGSTIVCDRDHLWQVLHGDGRRDGLSVVDTDELRQMLAAGIRCRVASAAPVMTGDRDLVVTDPAACFLRSKGWRAARVRDEICRHGRAIDGRIVLVGERPEFACLVASLGLVARVADGHTMIDLDAEGHAAREVVSVTSVSSRPVRCLQVDSPSSLFLCGRSFIPTHNTFLIGEELRRAARLAVQRSVPLENEIWYGAPTFLQAKRVMWNRLKSIIPREWMDGKPNESACSITLVSGHRMRVVGLDAHDALRGVGLWFFAGDEWADAKPEAWSETVRPMLSTTSGHALFVGTPKGHNHFYDLYQRGLSAEPKGHRSFRFSTAQGGQVPRGELDDARRLLDARTFRQEYEASFESFSGRVLYGFSREHNVKTSPDGRLGQLHVGMDFNINPMTATIWTIWGQELWQIDEIVLSTSNTDEMAATLREHYGRPEAGEARGVGHICVYPDPAGQQRRSSALGRTDVSILREAGFNVRVMTAHPAVRDRMNVMNRMFEASDGSRVAFVDPGCVKSIEAYDKLCYLDSGNQIDKSSGYDHLVDASGYFLYWWGTRQDVSARPSPYIMGR